MKLFLISLVIVGLCVFGMCFNIIFRKNGEFPETEVSKNKEMRKRGIRCAKEDEMKLWGRTQKKHPACNDSSCSECNTCGLYDKKSDPSCRTF